MTEPIALVIGGFCVAVVLRGYIRALWALYARYRGLVVVAVVLLTVATSGCEEDGRTWLLRTSAENFDACVRGWAQGIADHRRTMTALQSCSDNLERALFRPRIGPTPFPCASAERYRCETSVEQPVPVCRCEART